jgi:hypothetical protein
MIFGQNALNHETVNYLPDEAIPNLQVVLFSSKTFRRNQFGNISSWLCFIIH